MVAPEVSEFYAKYVPRWFKVIKWRNNGLRMLERYKPQTEEERLKLKRDTYNFKMQRDWDIGQWNHERPPLIDVWKRRRNYPEYYEGKYDGYKQDSVAYGSDRPGGIVTGLNTVAGTTGKKKE